MRLLVAEDNKAAKMHRSALKRRGHIVIVASNGEDCTKIYNDKLQDVRTLGQLKQKVHILEKPTEQLLIEKVEEANIYSALGGLNIDIDDFKRAHFTNEQLKKVLRILRKGKEIKPRLER